jgi:hypothetical protein
MGFRQKNISTGSIASAVNKIGFNLFPPNKKPLPAVYLPCEKLLSRKEGQHA